MTEPKWWVREWPSEVGFYYSVCPDGYRHITECTKPGGGLTEPAMSFYGPLPDPPKEPPKLRRFTAKHKRYGRVSGVYVEPSPKNPELYFNFAAWYLRESGSRDFVHGEESDFSDIVWLDKE